VGAWDRELESTGECLTAYRRQYADSLAEYVSEIGKTVLGHESHITYRQGWSEDRTLAEALEEGRDRDLKFGVTHAGPHRGDVSIQVASRKARGRISRGQQKLLGATLVLAQLAHLRSARKMRSILLLDDLAAELDAKAVERLREVISSLEAQLFLTALRRSDLAAWNCGAVFHVEQGKVLSVV
jgi:DNA replication and repair protein RecF